MLVFFTLTTLSNVIILYCYCYYGVLASESFERMAESLYESNWPELPVELQKNFIVMMANMQKSIFYSGFGFVDVNLNTFINVSSKSHLYLKNENFQIKIYVSAKQKSVNILCNV